MNLILLPTKEGKLQMTGALAGRAIHQGVNLDEYTEKIRKKLIDIMNATKSKTADEQREAIAKFQKEFSEALGKNDPEWALHAYDVVDGKVITMSSAFFVVSTLEEQRKAVQDQIDKLNYGLATGYTGNENDVKGWAGWFIDLFNPVADVKLLAEVRADYLATAVANGGNVADAEIGVAKGPSGVPTSRQMAQGLAPILGKAVESIGEGIRGQQHGKSGWDLIDDYQRRTGKSFFGRKF
jgi:hypothetical protein